ncbi:MAG: molybdopterin-dependent oxidoreductase [Nitrospirae bacterium]|nr:molybdopterin-dependent oxidoreductase [Nitrospirota bacterium]
MPTLTIDDKTVTIALGSTLLDAAKAAGARVPTLCNDDKLHPYGACRICMVEVMGTPRRMVTSCTTPAMEGMVIRTMSPAILEARKSILEFLLINHPLDCPVCDKAGDCRLQDLVHEHGLNPGTFAEKKRNLSPDFSSAVIERNTDRCILCGKCVRICGEQNAEHELAFTRRGGRSRISTSCDRPLDCEFCGECVEICPVGALTTRQFKYKARTWSLEETGSTCLYCGNGCPIKLETYKGRVVRVSPARNNFLCARGRFGWDAVHHEARLILPKMRVGGELIDSTWEEALTRVADALQTIKGTRGAASIGGLGSVRTTNEDNYLFQKFMRSVVGTNNIDLLARLKMPMGLNTSLFTAELASISESDVVLVLDRDVGEINPLTGIEIVRAVNQKGQKLILLNGMLNKFDRLASVSLTAGDAETALGDLIAAVGGDTRQKGEDIAEAVGLLMTARRVSIVLPAEPSPAVLDRAKYLAVLLGQTTLVPLVRRGNLQGALDMGVLPDYYPGYQKINPTAAARFKTEWGVDVPGTPGMNAMEILNSIVSGNLSALTIMGDDPVGNSPDIASVLKKLDFLVVQDIFLTETAKMADVVLPATSFIEKTGTVTNLERRLQRIDKAEEPLGESMPDWRIIQALAQKMGSSMNYASSSAIMKEIKSIVSAYKDLAVGACWPKELSPLHGTDADLSLSSETFLKREVITANRLLFSSGTMISRSKEIGSISPGKINKP